MSLWFLITNLPGTRHYEVSWPGNNHSSFSHVDFGPQSNSDTFNFVLNSKDTTPHARPKPAAIFSLTQGRSTNVSKQKPCLGDHFHILANSSHQQSIFRTGTAATNLHCSFTHQVRVEYTYSAVLMQWLVNALVTDDFQFWPDSKEFSRALALCSIVSERTQSVFSLPTLYLEVLKKVDLAGLFPEEECRLARVWDHMSCLILPKTTLCTPSWKNVKPHHRDSNQGPSAYRVDALWRSSHPQRHKHDISPTCLHILRSTGISHHSSGPSATTICQAKKKKNFQPIFFVYAPILYFAPDCSSWAHSWGSTFTVCIAHWFISSSTLSG